MVKTKQMRKDSPREYTIIFDGGSRGNPGEAYGSFVIRIAGGAHRRPVRLRYGIKTNNEAEYLSLFSSLETLLSDLKLEKIPPDSVQLTLQGDSKLILNQTSGDWKTKNERLKGLNTAVRTLLSRFSEVKFQHRPRSEIVKILGH
jgi:ribonuclease HI